MNQPQITPELVASHGLKPDEYARILQLIGRVPTFNELGLFSAMWNEHCSYKSSRIHLRGLPTKAPWVIQGPGENAGVIDIGDGQAVVFKMESHNHPSYIEPYQGATTGVGGILRDVFTMGARPIACLNALSFGAPEHPKTRHLVSGVVAGIGGYGNSFGVPTVGGQVRFHARYDGNILVNAMAVGLAETTKIFYAAASGVNMPIVYLGSKTGRDGIHGASMASAEFDDDSAEKRPTVQVGDPFAEKLLLEACLEIMAAGCVIAIQDMGDEAPVYDRPYAAAPPQPVIHARDIEPPLGISQALEKLIGTPELCSKRWVWEQYDHVILGNTVQRPGGDAAVVRVEDGPKGLALTVDVTPRYCEADPFEGGKQAVAEAWRNITAVGGRPLAITDNLNFGNPEKPEIMGQLVGCVRGIAEACKALDFPVVSGNVSLYNETQGRGILPTPSIGGVGVLADFTKSATLAFKAEGEAILLIGETQGWLGQSLYLRDVCGREDGAPPPCDLVEERENGDVVRALITEGLVTAAHDISDGGLLVAIAEMAMASGIGAALEPVPEDTPAHAFWFGEDQARYLVTVPAARATEVMERVAAASVPVHRIGATGGET